jgi:hypothetical protein
MKQALILGVMCCGLGCAAQPRLGGTPPAVASVRLRPPAPPSSESISDVSPGVEEYGDKDDDFTCLRLYTADVEPMTQARYRWTMDTLSESGTTDSGWIKVPCPPGCSVRVEWGPLLQPGEPEGAYPLDAVVTPNVLQGTREERAALMLNNMGYVSDLETAIMRFQIDENLGEVGLVDGKVPAKTWAALQKTYKDLSTDPNEPPECKD